LTVARICDSEDRRIDDLTRANLPLVGHIVREVMSRIPAHVCRDDLVSAGMYALAVSATSFDESRGVPFARFAAIRIRGAITDELRSMDWASRGVRTKSREVEATRAGLLARLGRTPDTQEIAQSLGTSAADVRSVEADVQRASVLSLQAMAGTSASEVLPTLTETPEAVLVRREQIGYLRDAIEELPERLRTVIKDYFFEQRRMTDIALDLGVTESRVSQMRAEALKLLQASFVATGSSAPCSPTVRPRVTAARAAYAAAVSARSTLAGRLTATNLLGESRLGLTKVLVGSS
jgi:RNA polymerase sigma factor for flagellar operon FliA